MKTINMIRTFFVALMIICISGISSYATKPEIAPAVHLQKIIQDGIKYPAQAVKNCCTGSVDVLFSVDEEGRIKIEKTYADNVQIEKMVKEQLANLSCKGIKTATFEHYKVTITFKLIG